MKKNVRDYVFWIGMILMLMAGIVIYIGGDANAMEVSSMELREDGVVQTGRSESCVIMWENIREYISELDNNPERYEYIGIDYSTVLGGWRVNYWDYQNEYFKGPTHCTHYFYTYD